MSNSEKPKFEVIDRRGQNREPIPFHVPTPKPKPEERTWVGDITFVLMVIQQKNGLLMTVRAIGQRSDDLPFFANAHFGPWWKEGENELAEQQKLARERLETFLHCGCDRSAACQSHRVLLQQWVAEDMMRVQALCQKPIPPALEMLMRAEMAAQQSKIVAAEAPLRPWEKH